MTKKRTQPATFRLSGKATKRLNECLSQIRQGIVSVCELHTHDSSPSLEQADFEELYIDKILSQTVTAVSVSIRAMADGLAQQKETAAQELDKNPQGENIKEDIQE